MPMMPLFISKILGVAQQSTSPKPDDLLMKGTNANMNNQTKEQISIALTPLAKFLKPQETTDGPASTKNEPTETVKCSHPVWRRGMLPGGKYVKTCTTCGIHEDVNFATWQTISDR